MEVTSQRHSGTAAWIRAASHAAMPPCLAMSLLSSGAVAQEPPSRPWPVAVAHYAKWPGLVATGTMLTLGFLAQRDAVKWRDSLAGSNPAAGPMHESAKTRARGWILGGEIALVSTGAMFLIDLIHRDQGPPNIPFTPFTVYTSPGRLGLSLRRR